MNNQLKDKQLNVFSRKDDIKFADRKKVYTFATLFFRSRTNISIILFDLNSGHIKLQNSIGKQSYGE
jgi:hypothetical protein